MGNLPGFLKRFIFIDIAVVILCGILAFLFFDYFMKPAKAPTVQKENPPVVVASQTPTPVVPSSKVWQLVLSFNTQTQQLSLSNISIKAGTANASPDHTSPYKLFVLDKNKKVLFQTDIVIAQQILYDLYFPPGSTPSALPTIPQMTSLVAVPYFAEGDIIQITKDNQTVLSFHPPKELSFSFPSLVQQSYAATCSLLHIVFVSDGYSDVAKFHADVQKAEATFTSKAPFSSHTNIFDFKVVDNPASKPLGCEENDKLNINCLFDNNLVKIADLVYSQYPQLPRDATYTKIVVLVDGGTQPFNGGSILGVANGVGGQFGVFQNQQFFEDTSTMEVLGHDVGQLYDRYVYPSSPGSPSDLGKSISPQFASNCSTSAQGEGFWKNAGVTQGYKGCTSQYMYAPEPLDCGTRGSSSTVMSAVGCAGPQFDAVEQYYLSTVILPRYLCAVSPTPTPSPTPTVAPTLVPGQQNLPSNNLPNTVVTPTFSYQKFDCQPDPSCNSKSNLQLCALKCTPK